MISLDVHCLSACRSLSNLFQRTFSSKLLAGLLQNLAEIILISMVLYWFGSSPLNNYFKKAKSKFLDENFEKYPWPIILYTSEALEALIGIQGYWLKIKGVWDIL